MDDRLRETLSAMLDDQADELAVRRLLNHSDQDAVRGQWRRWQQIRDLMHGDEGVVDHHVDVSAHVREALARPARRRQASGSRAWGRLRNSRVAGSLAVMSLALGFGFGSALNGPSSAPDTAEVQTAREGDGATGVPLQQLDSRQREYLSRYLLEHAQHSSVAASRGSFGFARVASVSGSAP